MGDATHSNVSKLPAGLQLVAGYVTGSPDIKWTEADWDRLPGIPHVTIDQGFTGSPVADAIVRDVEPGAWTAAAAVDKSLWTPPRPTIYCNRNDLQGVLAAGWKGDLWLAIPEPEPQMPPSVPGCTVVAVQFKFVTNFDLSVVFDPYWPALPPAGGGRVVADGVATVGGIASRHGVTVPELVAATVAHVRPGPFSADQRALLDHLADVRPLPGTVLWLP
jgi:hypothetical protein